MAKTDKDTIRQLKTYYKNAKVRDNAEILFLRRKLYYIKTYIEQILNSDYYIGKRIRYHGKK